MTGLGLIENNFARIPVTELVSRDFLSSRAAASSTVPLNISEVLVVLRGGGVVEVVVVVRSS